MKTYNKYIILLIIVLLLILLLITKPTLYEKYNDYFDCYLHLSEINPQFVNSYMKFDNKHVSTGKCQDATLHVTIDPCPTDSNGSPMMANCNETASLTSSKGSPIEFPYKITAKNLIKFFGINV